MTWAPAYWVPGPGPSRRVGLSLTRPVRHTMIDSQKMPSELTVAPALPAHWQCSHSDVQPVTRHRTRPGATVTSVDLGFAAKQCPTGPGSPLTERLGRPEAQP